MTLEFLQSLSGLLPKMGLPGEEDELLAGQNPSHGLSHASELLLSDLVHRFEEMSDHTFLSSNFLG